MMKFIRLRIIAQRGRGALLNTFIGINRGVCAITAGVLLLLACDPAENPNTSNPSWTFGPFEKLDDANPCLEPSADQQFICPILKNTVAWEVKDVFNPATILNNDTVFMIYRAEDTVGRHNGTSRLGIAWSTDGRRFTKHPVPILKPDEDLMKRYEWEGGIEDPRVVRSPDGRYIMTYTAYDGQTARLCVATSNDLFHWTKHGLAFNGVLDNAFVDTWSKSGAIVCRLVNQQPVAQKINNTYWMYWGDKHLHIATSDNLIQWTPVVENGELKKVMSFRPGYFDSDLVEPGPPALVTQEGIVLMYNARNYGPQQNPEMEEGTYSAGQVLLDKEAPASVLERTSDPFFIPDRPYEIEGQVNKVVFIEGMIPGKEEWLIYYGTADSKIGVASWKLK